MTDIPIDTTPPATRHPWNRDFAWVDHTGPFRRLTDSQVSRFDEQGFLVLPEVIDAEVLRAARREIDEFESEIETVLNAQADGRISIAEAGAITFTTHLVARSKRLAALSRHRGLLDICADLIGPDVDLYWDQAVYKKPQKPRRFPWHQDNGYTYVEPQQYLTCWLALNDASEANGCPWVVPGMHRFGTLAHTYIDPLGYECFTDADDAVVAEVAAGGVVVFSSLTPHLTGPNTTGDVRKAYILQYAPAGAEILLGDPDAGPPTSREPATAPGRQYPVLRAGEAV